MSPLPLLVVLAVKDLGLVTPPAETRSVCNYSNGIIVSVSMDICGRINIILQPCCWGREAKEGQERQEKPQ